MLVQRLGEFRLLPTLALRRCLKVHDAQCLGGNRLQSLGLGGNAGEHACAALSSFEEEDGLPVVAPRQGFCHKFAFFQLVHRLDATLQGVLQRGHGCLFQHA